ncbi:helix-turn-helix domain-containing protein [Roseibium sediminis]|uniref:helix-turn-helix domain-containing protein n=1 Tax=Roseibium sediminis TaxID=1775174 RepID=UPI00123CC81C|nr:helix-turn-helix domain-containing protein [Roseibium sediminis]
MAKPKNPPRSWDYEAIKAELHRQGMTFAKLAELAGISPKYMAKVKRNTTRKAEKAIADFFETPAEEIWPDRYPIRPSLILSNKYDPMGARAKSPPSSGQSSDQEAA